MEHFICLSLGCMAASAAMAVALSRTFHLIDWLVLVLAYGMAVQIKIAHNGNGWMLVIPIGVLLYCLISLLLRFLHRREKISRISVRDAIEALDMGLCFARPGGDILLANREMHRAAEHITGTSLWNAEEFWQTAHRLPKGPIGEKTIRLEDGTIYRLSRTTIEDEREQLIQISLYDVTAQYQRSLEVQESTQRLQQMEQELGEILQNIAQIKQEEELLDSKIRIHDRLGNLILNSRQTLAQEEPLTDVQRRMLIDQWNRVAMGLQNTLLSEDRNESSLDSVRQLARKLGCNIVLRGAPLPQSSVVSYTLREAMYNAIRHAGADTLTCEVREDGETVSIHIWDNGRHREKEIREGGGLSTLRRRVEGIGGRLWIAHQSGNGVELYLQLKKEEVT